MAAFDQIFRCHFGGLHVVGTNSVQLFQRTGPRGADHGHAQFLSTQTQFASALHAACQHNAFHALRHQHIKAALQLMAFCTALRQHQQLALLFQRIAKTGNHLGIKRRAQVTHDQSHRAAAAATQHGGGAVRHITE